jgi:hypothetical protein
MVVLLDRRIERIHVGVSDNSWPGAPKANHRKGSLDQRGLKVGQFCGERRQPR